MVAHRPYSRTTALQKAKGIPQFWLSATCHLQNSKEPKDMQDSKQV